jgi:hypothetical protein
LILFIFSFHHFTAEPKLIHLSNLLQMNAATEDGGQGSGGQDSGGQGSGGQGSGGQGSGGQGSGGQGSGGQGSGGQDNAGVGARTPPDTDPQPSASAAAAGRPQTGSAGGRETPKFKRAFLSRDRNYRKRSHEGE